MTDNSKGSVIAYAKFQYMYTQNCIGYRIFSQSGGNDYLVGLWGKDRGELEGHIQSINYRREELNLPNIVIQDCR